MITTASVFQSVSEMLPAIGWETHVGALPRAGYHLSLVLAKISMADDGWHETFA